MNQIHPKLKEVLEQNYYICAWCPKGEKIHERRTHKLLKNSLLEQAFTSHSICPSCENEIENKTWKKEAKK